MKPWYLLFVFLTACNFSTGPGPEEPPTPVECGAHAWGDDDRDGVGYRLPTTDVFVNNTSGYALDLKTLGMGILNFIKSGFEIPMVRVNLPGIGWLGLAQVWIRNSTGEVDRAKVQMNEAYSVMADPNVYTHVGCMEVLHCAGLSHQEAEDSCMSDCSEARDWSACMRDPNKQTPGVHDQEQLAKIYGADHPPPTVCVQGEFTLLTFKFPAPSDASR